MKFTLTPMLALASTALADSLYVTEVCFFECSRSGVFTTSAGSYTVNANNGCRSTSVPGMTEFCMDWGREYPRGHFRFSHQNNKRCLTQTRTSWYSCGTNTCWETWFDESPCTWREAGGDGDEEDIATVSAIAAEAEPTGALEWPADPEVPGHARQQTEKDMAGAEVDEHADSVDAEERGLHWRA